MSKHRSLSFEGCATTARLGTLIVALLALTACQSPAKSTKSHRNPARPGVLADVPAGGMMHLVIIELHDPNDIPLIMEDSLNAIGRIPGVTFQMPGRSIEIERSAPLATNTGEATASSSSAPAAMLPSVVFLIGFDSLQAYRKYLVHPAHLELTERWRDRIANVTIHDFEPADSPDQEQIWR